MEQRGSLPLSTYDGRIVKIQSNVWMTATGNPPWSPRNIGVAPLDEADSSRLAHIEVPYNSVMTDFRILLTRTGDTSNESQMAAARAARVLAELRATDFPLACGTRAALTAYRMMRVGADFKDAVYALFSYEDPGLWRMDVHAAIDTVIDATPAGALLGKSTVASVLGRPSSDVDAVVGDVERM
jgi:hypothetical protein